MAQTLLLNIYIHCKQKAYGKITRKKHINFAILSKVTLHKKRLL